MDNTTDFNATVYNQLRRLRAMSEDAHGTAEALDSESNYAAWD